MGTLYRNGKYTYFSYRENGENKTISLGDIGVLTNGKKKDIKRKLESQYEDNKTRRVGSKPTPLLIGTIKVVINERLKRLKMDQLSENTVNGDIKKLNYFKDFVLDKYGNISVGDIDEDLLNSYTDYCRDVLGNNPTSINNRHKCVQILTKYCLDKGYFNSDPYRKVVIPKPIKRGKDRIPKQNEYDTIKEYLNNYIEGYINKESDYPFNPIIMTSFFQVSLGMRIGEVLIMKWRRGKDDFGEGHSRSYVYLNSSLTELVVYFKKKKRTYPIDEIPIITELLKRIKSDMKSKVYVLENHILKKDGKPHPQSTGKRFQNTYCSRPLKSLLRKLGIDDSYSTHSLRHGFVTDLIRKNHSLTKIGNLVGHSDIRMTELYGHLDTSDMRGLLRTV